MNIELKTSTPNFNTPDDCLNSQTLKYNADISDISTVMEHSLCTEYSQPSSEDTINS